MMSIYIINRNDRPERLAHMREQLRIQKLNGRRVEAIIDKPGWKGCRDSHLKVHEEHNSDLFYIILEDDVKFKGDVQGELSIALRELPDDWDVLYLGCNPRKPQKQYSEHLFKIDGAVCLHAALYHPRKGGLVEYMLAHRDEIEKIDRYFMEVLQPMFGCYMCYPMLATQDSRFKSDTCKRADYDQIWLNYLKYIVAYASDNKTI